MDAILGTNAGTTSGVLTGRAGNNQSDKSDKSKDFSVYMKDYMQGADMSSSSTDSVQEADVVVDNLSAADRFLEYMAMTPAQRYYEMFLAQAGLTQEDLDAMPLEDRIKIEKMIEQRIEEKLKEDAKEMIRSV